jgi:hypothetical protein
MRAQYDRQATPIGSGHGIDQRPLGHQLILEKDFCLEVLIDLGWQAPMINTASALPSG